MKYEFTINFWNRFLISNTSKILQKAKKTNEGFSLLELSIGVGIALILTLSGVMAYANLNTNSRQSAANQAAESAYNKAMAFELDNDSKTTPKQVEEEYNSKNDGIVVDVEELGSGRVKVVATYSDGITQATRITPVSGSSSDNGSEHTPGEEENQVLKKAAVFNYRCDETLSGYVLPFNNYSDDYEAALTGSDGSFITIGTITNSSGTKRLESTPFKAGVDYRLVFTGDFESYGGSLPGRLSSCLRSVETFGLNNGVKKISSLGANIEEVPNELPETVESINGIFYESSKFNDDSIKEWDTSNIKNMSRAFRGATLFNVDISDWNVSKLEDMSEIFYEASNFDQPVGKWNVSSVINMQGSFLRAVKFNQPLNDWDVSNVENMRMLFQSTASFDQPLNNWDTSSVINMSQMFASADSKNLPVIFNQPLNNWDTSNVTSMSALFWNNKHFNQDIGNWETGNVVHIYRIFEGATNFNQNINNWDTSNVTSMQRAFHSASSYNQPLDNWDTSNVTNMSYMFTGTGSFNQDISKWNVSKVSNMDYMFSDAAIFDHDISNWKVPLIETTPPFFNSVFNSGNPIGGKIPLDQYPQWGVA